MYKKENLIDYIESRKSDFTAISDCIWENPELRFDLGKSSKILIDALKKEGFTVETGLAGMKDAFVGVYGTGTPVIAFLGEYDALSNLSQQADSDIKVTDSKMVDGHGCGHNLLGTGALLAATSLKKYMEENKLSGTIKFFGCPAEEGGSGKAFMARDGVFKGLDSIITWHPMTENKIWGVSSLANFQIFFSFKGKSSHAAAAPEHGRSALDAAELMNVGVNYLREHVIQEARIHYAYMDVGGQSPNVVQPTASLLYYIRAPKSYQVKSIYDRIVKIAEGAALMTETELTVKWDSACSEYLVNKTLAKVMYDNMVHVGDIKYTQDELNYANKYFHTLDETAIKNHENVIRKNFSDLSEDKLKSIIDSPIVTALYPFSVSDQAMPGSTDVGDASFQAPTTQVITACYPAGTSPHSWQWVATGKSSVAHKGMLYASKVMALTAVDILENPDVLKKAKEEFDAKLEGDKYKSYIPKDVKPS